jgi:hypothetical protein
LFLFVDEQKFWLDHLLQGVAENSEENEEEFGQIQGTCNKNVEFGPENPYNFLLQLYGEFVAQKRESGGHISPKITVNSLKYF